MVAVNCKVVEIELDCERWREVQGVYKRKALGGVV